MSDSTVNWISLAIFALCATVIVGLGWWALLLDNGLPLRLFVFGATAAATATVAALMIMSTIFRSLVAAGGIILVYVVGSTLLQILTLVVLGVLFLVGLLPSRFRVFRPD